ncbi:MAG TPA: hypothetical protein PK156_26790 [Polyangium sp.]|nr:hypothetical protein [Polyangium sp.]
MVRRSERIRGLEWAETQVTGRSRRLDRLLYIDTTDSKRRILHIEWFMRLDVRALERTAEYHLLSVMLARQDARRHPRRRRRVWRGIAVESIIVVLTGRTKPWPKFAEYRTSPVGKRFSGVRFRIEAVYQQTVDELLAKGSVFWYVFVPLAKDADEMRVRRTVEILKAQTNEAEFVEVIAAMLVMAEIKKDRPELAEVIRLESMLNIRTRNPLFVELEDRGRQEGLRQGHKKGLQEGLEKGLEKALLLLLCLLERRLGRSVRVAERARIVRRLKRLGPEKLASAVLDLSPDALATWLKPKKLQRQRSKTSFDAHLGPKSPRKRG